MTRPTLGVGLARVHVYDRDGITSRGILNGGDATTGGTSDLTWTHSKSTDGSTLSFTAPALDPAMVADPAMLEDALAVVELNVGGTWTPIGTPYVLSPGTGTVIGAAEGGARMAQPSGVGAVQGLPGEWLVLHSGGVVNRRGPTDRYIGWQTSSFDASTWNTPDQKDPATDFTITDAKYGQPAGWPAAAAAAKWVYRDDSHGDTGGLTLFRFGSFTVSTKRKYRIGFSCDEECVVYLDGPGWGGQFASSSDQETGYVNYNRHGEVLDVGTYFVAAEMTTVNSAGGDGFDAMRLFVSTVDDKDQVDTVVLTSNSTDTKVHRQAKTAVRPGFTPDGVVDLIRSENATWGVPSASLLTVVAADTMPTGEERVWPVGTSGAQVLSDLEPDVTADVDLSYNLNLSASPTGAAVTFTAGAATPTAAMNLEGLGWTSDPVTGTRAVVLTNDGFVEAIDAASEAAADARGMYLESGASGSIAKGKAYAMDAIAQQGRVRRAYQVDLAAVTGIVPWVNFGLHSTATMPDYQLGSTSGAVVSMTGTNGVSHAAFTVEVGEV